MSPETPNTRILFSDNHTICGKIPIRPAKVAPIPIDTSRLGSAQQMIVPKDENKDR